MNDYEQLDRIGKALDQIVQEELDLPEGISEDSDAEYDKHGIENFTTAFNIDTPNAKPDIRNVKYLTAIDHLQCPICQQPFIQPMTTLCGHTFCKDCIYECFKMAKDSNTSDTMGLCPLDRTPIDVTNSNDLFPTPILINNLVDDLKVYCLNNERGCPWIGCRWEIEHHVMAACDYTGVICNMPRTNGKTCELLVERRFLSDEECVHKLYECQYCKQNVTKISEEAHLNEECLFNYQTCDMCMNDMIPLKYMDDHQSNCTKMSRFICPAKEIGCKFIANTEPSLENHIKNNCQLNSFLPFYKSQSERMDSLESENKFLQKQINQILNLIVQGRITNLGYNEPIEEISRFKDFSDADQDKLVYLNYEIERLKCQIDEKLMPFINKQTNEREPVINNLVNDTFMMKDDLNLQRMLINSLRKQIQFILFKNHRPAFNGLNMDEDLSDSDERLNLKL